MPPESIGPQGAKLPTIRQLSDYFRRSAANEDLDPSSRSLAAQIALFAKGADQRLYLLEEGKASKQDLINLSQSMKSMSSAVDFLMSLVQQTSTEVPVETAEPTPGNGEAQADPAPEASPAAPADPPVPPPASVMQAAPKRGPGRRQAPPNGAGGGQ